MMRLRILLVMLAVATVGTAVGGAGCSPLLGAQEGATHEHGVAEVDSLQVPSRIAPTDTLSVRMHGTAGPNGCYSFDGFDAIRSRNRLTVTPVVKHETAEELACTMAIVPLDETYAAAPPFETGTLTVVVPQPDGPGRTATVEVR